MAVKHRWLLKQPAALAAWPWGECLAGVATATHPDPWPNSRPKPKPKPTLNPADRGAQPPVPEAAGPGPPEAGAPRPDGQQPGRIYCRGKAGAGCSGAHRDGAGGSGGRVEVRAVLGCALHAGLCWGVLEVGRVALQLVQGTGGLRALLLHPILAPSPYPSTPPTKPRSCSGAIGPLLRYLRDHKHSDAALRSGLHTLSMLVSNSPNRDIIVSFHVSDCCVPLHSWRVGQGMCLCFGYQQTWSAPGTGAFFCPSHPPAPV